MAGFGKVIGQKRALNHRPPAKLELRAQDCFRWGHGLTPQSHQSGRFEPEQAGMAGVDRNLVPIAGRQKDRLIPCAAIAAQGATKPGNLRGYFFWPWAATPAIFAWILA